MTYHDSLGWPMRFPPVAKPPTPPGEDAFPPVRLCCGRRHLGPVCPDGQVMCCLCFERKRQEDLNVLADGRKEDVCKACAEEEKRQRPTTDDHAQGKEQDTAGGQAGL